MKALSILQIILGLVLLPSMTLQLLTENYVAVVFGVVVILQCVIIISITESRE